MCLARSATLRAGRRREEGEFALIFFTALKGRSSTGIDRRHTSTPTREKAPRVGGPGNAGSTP